MVGGRWALVGGRWSVAGGRWPVVGGRWSVVGRWPVISGQWSAVGGRWSVVGGRWSVVGSRWSVVGGRWSVVGGWRTGGLTVGRSAVAGSAQLPGSVCQLAAAHRPLIRPNPAGRPGRRSTILSPVPIPSPSRRRRPSRSEVTPCGWSPEATRAGSPARWSALSVDSMARNKRGGHWVWWPAHKR